jgi:hypothetical protein
MQTVRKVRAGQPAPLHIPVRRVNAEQFDAPFENRFAKQADKPLTDEEKDGAEEMIAFLIVLVLSIAGFAVWWTA